MMLDAFGSSFADQQQRLATNAAAAPPQPLEPSALDAFKTTFEAAKRYNGLAALDLNQADFVQSRLDAFERATGKKITNPWGMNDAYRPKRLAAVRKQFEDHAAGAIEGPGDPALTFPTDEEIWNGGLKLARDARTREAVMSQGPMGPAARAASLGGELAYGMSDPMNVVAMAVGLGTGSVFMQAARLGGAFMLQSAIQEAVTFDQKKTINPEHSVGEAAGDVLMFGLQGAGLELGGKAVGAAWRRLRRRAPEVASDLPLEARDAGTVAERAADLEAQNPFAGAEGHAAHAEAVAKVEKDLLDGVAPSSTPAMEAEAAVRRGQVFQPSFDVWHGSPHSFDAFSIDKIGTGEGAQVFGRGLYFAENEKIALGYKEKLGKKAGVEGNLYQVRINADRDHFLDWDKPISEQTPYVREALAKIPRFENYNKEFSLDRNGMSVGELIQRGLLPASFDKTSESFRKTFMDAGIQGVRYLDAGSRGGKDGTRNFVVFDDKIARITHKNGEAVAPPARSYIGSRAIDLRYELAEARDLVASHDRDFRVNPDYPADLQPRDRSSKAARDQVFDMAANLEPERLGPSPEANAGAPIIGPDNVVESGNGRTMAIRQAYDLGNDRSNAYRMWLERQGYDTAGFDQPVLVGRRTSVMADAERAEFAHAANGSASLRMNAVEQALSDARHISGELADLLQKGKIDSAANRDFVRSLVAKMPQGERGGMLTKGGQLSASGVARMNAAIMARAYGDAGVVARTFDHAESNIKNIAHALLDAAPEWIKIREAVANGEIAAGHDITDALMQSVKTIMRARDEGEPVARALAQGDFFTSDTSGLAARLFFKDGSLTRFLSKADMAENLSSFAQGVLDQRGKGADLFGAPPPDTKAVLGNVVKISEARQSQIADALKPEAIEKAYTDPKVHDAAVAQLDRNIEQGRNRVPVEDADGNVTMGFADAELHRIDQEIAAAAEIRSCTMPGGGEIKEAG